MLGSRRGWLARMLCSVVALARVLALPGVRGRPTAGGLRAGFMSRQPQ